MRSITSTRPWLKLWILWSEVVVVHRRRELRPETGAPQTRALARPERVVQSASDAEARLYYRFYTGTIVGDKHLCVVVKVLEADAFVITAYLTDTIAQAIVMPIQTAC